VADSGRAWARALFSAAGATAARRLIADALDTLAGAMREHRVFREALKDPAVPNRLRIELIEAALPVTAPLETRELYARFAKLLVGKGRIGLLPSVAVTHRRLLDAEEGVVRLDIEAAREPDEARVRRMTEAWSRAGAGEKVIARVRLRPELLGGYRLRAGSIRYDFSIVGRLERLRKHLARPTESAREEG
jgi:F-type H+-transporting ATPase subunit delta